jgi:deoxyribonuclease-1-like protein
LRKFILLFLLFISFSCYSQHTSSQNISVCSWNLKDFGKSKSDQEITVIANILKSFDVIAVQEVVAGYGGPQAIARLADQLNRSGAAWEYALSAATSGTSHQAERYAYIWKKTKVKKMGEPWLESKYGAQFDREPYYGRFKVAGKVFTLVSFHAIPKSKQPETEIKYFKYLPPLYPNDNLIFCGDFNLPQSHSVFTPLRKMGYISSMVNQKTSLRQKCINNDCLASEYDNFYFNESKINFISAGIIHFYKAFDNLKVASLVSDHVPIFLNFSLKG